MTLQLVKHDTCMFSLPHVAGDHRPYVLLQDVQILQNLHKHGWRLQDVIGCAPARPAHVTEEPERVHEDPRAGSAPGLLPH